MSKVTIDNFEPKSTEKKCFFDVEVDKEFALHLLKHNVNNFRKPTKGVVKNYAKQMKEGHWGETANAVSFDINGYIDNGQHTLLGVVAADTTVKLNLIVGMPTTAKKHYDNGKKRSVAELLDIEKRVGETTRYATTFALGLNKGDIQDIELVGKSGIYDAVQYLLDFHPGKEASFTSAAPLLAASLLIISGCDKGVIANAYRDLATNSLSKSSIAHWYFNKTLKLKAKRNNADKQDHLIMLFRVYDPVNYELSSLSQKKEKNEDVLKHMKLILNNAITNYKNSIKQ